MSITHVANILEGTCDAVKEYAAWRGLTTEVKVMGLISTDQDILREAVDYVEAHASLPAIGDSLAQYPNLLLKSITPSILADETGVVICKLEYIPVSEYEGLGILIPEATLQQVETQVDRLGQDLELEHTYPADDIDFPSETIPQGGNATVDTQSLILRTTLKRQTTFPLVLVREWLGKLNSTTWQGFGTGLWKCIECQPNLWDVSTTPYTYMVEFAFQLNPSGWNPSIVFIDQRDGKPPANTVFNVGRKTFVWNDSKDFNEVFPTPAAI